MCKKSWITQLFLEREKVIQKSIYPKHPIFQDIFQYILSDTLYRQTDWGWNNKHIFSQQKLLLPTLSVYDEARFSQQNQLWLKMSNRQHQDVFRNVLLIIGIIPENVSTTKIKYCLKYQITNLKNVFQQLG